MARGIGQLVVSLGLDAAEFVTGMSRAEIVAEKTAKQMERQLAQGAHAVGLALGTMAAKAGATAIAVDQMLKSVADFKDLEETTGAAAEGIASLSLAAAVAGVDIENVAGSMQKLTKNLTGVDDESKAAGAALAALGLNVAEFKRLDPVSQYEAVGKALGQFADGAEKTGVAMALFGKSGAEQLKVFKALEEQGGRTVALTQEQIDAADKYADAQALAVAQLKQYAQVAAVEFLPAMNDLLIVVTDVAKAFTTTDTAAGALAAQQELREFADGLAKSLALVADFAIGVAKGFEVVGKTIGAAFAIAKAAREGQLEQARAIATELEADINRITTYLSLSERLDKQRAARQQAERAAAANPASYSNEGRTRQLPTLQFDGAKTDAAEKARDKARKEAMRKREEAERMQQRATDEWIKDQVRLVEDQFAREQKAADDFAAKGVQVFEAVRTPVEKFQAEMVELIDLQEKGAITWETYTRAGVAAQDRLAEALKKTSEEVSEFQKEAMRNVQDFVGTELNNLLEGNFDNIGKRFLALTRKMAADAAAAKINEALLGKDGTSGAIGGFLSRFLGGSSGGSSPFEYTDSSGGFSMVPQMATGTNFVPRDMLAFLHKGEEVTPREYNPAAGGVRPGSSGVNLQVINNGEPVTASTTTERQPDGTELIKVVLDRVAKDFRDGGKIAGAAQQTYGLKRNNPRR